MKLIHCADCGRNVPMNKSYRRGDKMLCDQCCDKPDEVSAVRQIDPTICRNCGHDNGDTPFQPVAGLPTCPACTAFFRNRPFPLWIKGFFVALAVLVVVSFAWNLRFICGYAAMRQAVKALDRQDLVAASARAGEAARRVPESQDLAALRDYTLGILALRDQKSAEALKLLRACRDRLPPGFGVVFLIRQTEAIIAFDAKDYDKYLGLAHEIAAMDEANWQGDMMVASGYACKYAITGDLSLHEQTLLSMAKAKKAAGNDPGFAKGERRLLHRLHTREIISPEEYARRFPDGWRNEKEAMP